MNKNTLKEIVLEQQTLLDKSKLGIARQALEQIKNYTRLPHVIVISGLRRSGKSTLLTQIFQKFYKGEGYYFNFEDERLVDFVPSDFNDLYEIFLELFGEKKTFFLDEIQNIPGWESFVRRMYDQKFKFFITGSNASLLSKEIGTKLTGRHIPVHLHPFSFREFLDFRGYHFSPRAFSLTQERGALKKYFNEYLENGGMPEFLKYREREILVRTYEDILYRDIVARHNIKEVKAFKELALYLLSNTGALFTYNRLKGAFHLGSMNTLKSYVHYLEDSFLISVIGPFSYSLKQHIQNPKKAYGIDTGILSLVSFRFSENRRRFLENLVFTELDRRQHEVYYYRTRNGLEVDFLTRKGPKILELVQVTQSLGNKSVYDREIKALLTAMNELALKTGLILSEDEEKKIHEGDKIIQVKPVYKWLLEG